MCMSRNCPFHQTSMWIWQVHICGYGTPQNQSQSTPPLVCGEGGGVEFFIIAFSMYGFVLFCLNLLNNRGLMSFNLKVNNRVRNHTRQVYLFPATLPTLFFFFLPTNILWSFWLMHC